MQNIISCFLKGYLNSTQSLEAKVTSLEAEIPKIDAAIKNIKNDTISSLNSRIQAIQEDIAGLKLNDTQLQTKINTVISEDLENLTNRTDNIEKNIGDNDGDIANLNDRLTTLGTLYASRST